MLSNGTQGMCCVGSVMVRALHHHAWGCGFNLSRI